MPAQEDIMNASIRGADRTVKWLRDQRASAVKAHETAVKVEGFRLKNKLQAEIRKGSPGGRQHSPLSYIARRLSLKRPNRAPLERLAYGVRYNVSANPFEMKIGFVQPTHGPHSVSKSWQRLAKRHQKGFTRDITDAQRQYIIWRGGNLGKVDGGDTPFFLRRSTQQFKTPARPIIDPFWRDNEKAAEQNIRINFRRKMKGQKI